VNGYEIKFSAWLHLEDFSLEYLQVAAVQGATIGNLKFKKKLVK